MLFRVLLRAAGLALVFSLLASCSTIDRSWLETKERQSADVTKSKVSADSAKLALLIRRQQEQAALLREVSDQLGLINNRIGTLKTASPRTTNKKTALAGSFSQCLTSCRADNNDYYKCRQQCTCRQECLMFDNQDKQACKTFCASD